MHMAETHSLGIHVVWLATSQFHGGVVGADVAADVDGVGVDDGLGEERGLEAFVGVDGGFGGHVLVSLTRRLWVGFVWSG